MLLRIDILEDIEIILVTLGADAAVVDGLLNGAPGLVAMGAVGKMAVMEQGAHFGEEMGEFLRAEVHHAKLLDAGGVDEVSDEW